MKDNDDIQDKLIETINNLDKVTDDLVKTINKMLSYCGLLLLILFGIALVAIIY